MKHFTALSAIAAFALMQAAADDGSANGGAPVEGDGSVVPGNGPTSASGRIKVAEKDIDEETGTVSIAFTDGSSADVELSSFSENIQKMLALHGLSQKLGDSYASVKGDVAAAKTKFEAVLTQLQAGEWKKAREAGEGGSKVTELAAAIAQYKGADLDKAMAVVAKATKEQLAAWRANPKLKAIIADIRARKAAERAAKAEKDAAAKGGEPATDGLDGLDLS